MLLPFQGDITILLDTQGVALGYMLVGLSGRSSSYFGFLILPN